VAALPRKPPRLGRARIVAAALALVDRHGIDALTMRRLAEELGTAPMSLYRHIAGKDELMALVIEAFTAELSSADPRDPWDAVVRTTFTRVHRLLRRHPGIVAHLADGAIVSPAGLEVTETVLAALRRAGLDDAEAAGAFTSLWMFTVGSALLERAVFDGTGDEGATWERLSELTAAGAAGRYPGVAEAATHWMATPADVAFENGLSLLLDAVRARSG
jgi:AcrR family transcriptional regulator